MRNYISIGFQCTVPFALNKANLKGPTLPFDWMLAPPRFVHTMLELLLVRNMNTSELVTDHFYPTTTWAQWTGRGPALELEEYREYPEKCYPYNKPYSAIFPHDGDDKSTTELSIEKYIRRFDRMKEMILDTDADNVFVYISPSSSLRYHGNYFIDGIEILTNPYEHLNNIYDLLSTVRGEPVNMLALDSFDYADAKNLNTNIHYKKVEAVNGWMSFIDVCVPEIVRYDSIL